MSSQSRQFMVTATKENSGRRSAEVRASEALHGGAVAEVDSRRRGAVGAAYFNTRNMLV